MRTIIFKPFNISSHIYLVFQLLCIIYEHSREMQFTLKNPEIVPEDAGIDVFLPLLDNTRIFFPAALGGLLDVAKVFTLFHGKTQR